MEAGMYLAFVLLFFTSCSLQQEAEPVTGERVHRDVEGLMPFPRVGRRDTSLVGRRGASSGKRQQGLMAFPRIGRSGNSDPRYIRPWMIQEVADNSKPSGSASASSPWFGPRLGRSQRHFEAANPYAPWSLVGPSAGTGILRGQRGRESSFTPRLGRELEVGSPSNDFDEEELRPTGL